ncbi:hypothetical protein RvVAR0630_32370 [Agrobacterium vitis]|uniref:hypothetical protein n=1 Tax=Agrobacterium vitis TaxID=373 RepID=UPI0015D840D8|nr:hypothetical protein [Agrobacterium vitis]BCH60613.1 hypothetical protein RvVAR0630_32370 [Agrobacterium vitis]
MASDQKHFEVEYDIDGKIVDFLSLTALDVTPEERVRQRYLRVLDLPGRSGERIPNL